MTKPKIALYWCASCGGCEESVIDLAEDLLTVVEAVDIVFWPVALDFKYSDVEALADGEITASLINGAVRTDEQEVMAKLLRQKSRLIIAHGSCAHLGGVIGLANLFNGKEMMERAYLEVPSLNNPQMIMPQTKTEQDGKNIKLPGFHDQVKALNQVIEVDYYLPGCPTPPELIKIALTAILEDKLPPKGTVLAEKKAVCNTCSRRDSKPQNLKIKEFKRLYATTWDAEICFLAQSLICLGPATRGGCDERCIKGNMPCRGCFGPLDNVDDFGAKFLSSIASIFESRNPADIKSVTDSIPDIAGLFYQYSLASSILKGKVKRENE